MDKVKIYLTGMSGPKSLVDLQELIDPIKQYLDGLVWVLHDAQFEPENIYLDSVKGSGRVIQANYCQRHDFSRNHVLFCGGLKNGDWCIQVDDKERINPVFASSINKLIGDLLHSGINMCYYYGKPFIFQFHESLVYQGNPHEGLHRQDGKTAAISLEQYQPIESEVRYSIRHLIRDPYHWVGHYLKYMLYPWGSNHSLLGLADRTPPEKLNQAFFERCALKDRLKEILTREGCEQNLNGFVRLFGSRLSAELKEFLNKEKIFQDAYRYYILGDLSVKDGHKQEDWDNMVKY